MFRNGSRKSARLETFNVCGGGGGESVVHIKIRFLKFLEGVEKKTFKV